MNAAGQETQHSYWDLHAMAVERVELRRDRILKALCEAGVPHALVGGQAVALWVSTVDPSAIRTTKDVDILIEEADLPRARKAANAAGFDYFEAVGVGMFLDKEDPRPKSGVHLLWSGKKVKAEYPLPSPRVSDGVELQPGYFAVKLEDLLQMKLMANRDHDRAHVRDMIGVGLIGREQLAGMPEELARRYEQILSEEGK